MLLVVVMVVTDTILAQHLELQILEVVAVAQELMVATLPPPAKVKLAALESLLFATLNHNKRPLPQQEALR